MKAIPCLHYNFVFDSLLPCLFSLTTAVNLRGGAFSRNKMSGFKFFLHIKKICFVVLLDLKKKKKFNLLNGVRHQKTDNDTTVQIFGLQCSGNTVI